MALKHVFGGLIYVAACCCASSSTCSPEAQATGTCGAADGYRMLVQRDILEELKGGESVQHGEIVDGSLSVDDSDGAAEEEGQSEASKRPCCLDDKIDWKRVSPDEISQKGNPHGVVEECKTKIGWEQSAYIKDLMTKNGDDPTKFKFTVCFDANSDPNKRTFPWLHANTRDWTFHLMHEGSVIVQPEDLNPLWMKGYGNIVPDALDYYARMGEIAKRNIFPRFMLYGYSKGAAANWNLGRWRPDVVQAVVSVSGFVDKKYYTTPEVKARSDGASPYYFTASSKDTYTPGAYGAADKQCKMLQNNAISGHLSVLVEFPCGHHPDQCSPKCDFEEIFTEPFWSFVRSAEPWRGCPHWQTKEDCDATLCKWDSELQSCDMLHPTEINPSCKRFCFKTQVDTCEGAPSCESSYRKLSTNEAAAKGMHVACQLDGARCVDSDESFQCFFQDQCPQASCIDEQTLWQEVQPDEISPTGNPHGIVEECQDHVTWQQSGYIKGLMEAKGDDPKQFMFSVCWDDASDPEERTFPWLHANSEDWKYFLMQQGSVIIQPMDLLSLWMKGYVNIIADALDYFARMGEVSGRKIFPRFMVYGFTKGAGPNWDLGRWRPDVVQAVITISGMKSSKYYTKEPEVKAPPEGSGPFFFISSPDDTLTPKAPKDSEKSYDFQKKTAISARLTVNYRHQCGQHPVDCSPLCDDFNATFTEPFWTFVRSAETWRGCPQWETEEDCTKYLCKWDSDLQSCDMLHPTEMNPSCQLFCDKTQVVTCEGAPNCESSYRMLSVEEAAANGMHVACKLDGGNCVDNAESFQCLFQDHC